MTIRLARADELERLREVERAASALFAGVGLHDVADDPPASVEVLATYQRDGRAWVSVDVEDRPVGYALALVVDGLGHLEQLSVDPASGRQGRGAALVEVVAGWSAAGGRPAVTLSTFRSVPWNAPYYARLGFRELDDDDLTPGLLQLRGYEVVAGLDVAQRCFMRRDRRGRTG